MARFCALFSGSSGNSTYIGSGDCGILVDAGVSAKQIINALENRDIDPRRIAGIFLTHEHIDHIRGLRVLSKRLGVPVFASVGTLNSIATGNFVEPGTPLIEINGASVEVGGLELQSFATSHDGAQPLGYRIATSDGRLLGIATDLGIVTEEVDKGLAGCDLVLLEANYDEGMLACSAYPYYLKRRIRSQLGHLSNVECAAELSTLAARGTTRLVLGHLSKENNHPDVARQTIYARLVMDGLKEQVDFMLQVARRHEPSAMIVL